MSTPKKSTPAKKSGKLPSKPLSFSNQPKAKGGKAVSASAVTSGKKGGVNLMRKLSGM